MNEKLKNLYEIRDKQIKELHSTFHQLSDLIRMDMTDEDLDLWTEITSHSTIQKMRKEI